MVRFENNIDRIGDLIWTLRQFPALKASKETFKRLERISQKDEIEGEGKEMEDTSIGRKTK